MIRVVMWFCVLMEKQALSIKSSIKKELTKRLSMATEATGQALGGINVYSKRSQYEEIINA